MTDTYDTPQPTQRPGGSPRNTVANLLSKQNIDFTNPGGAAALPALSPASTANYYQQLAGLYAQYQLGLGDLRAQRIGYRADYKQQRVGIRSSLISAMSEQEGSAIERNVLGSSADLEQRIALKGQAAAQQAQARTDMLQGVAQTRVAEAQLGLNYFMGSTGLQATALAEQQQALAQQLEQNLIVSGMESQADAMGQIYEAIAARFGGPPRRGRGRTRPITFATPSYGEAGLGR